MANLVTAVNPRVKFSEEQIKAILDEVFRTYANFIDGDKGLRLDGLLRTYDDGAGDVDRDYRALGMDLGSDSASEEEEEEVREEESRDGVASGRKEDAISIMNESPGFGPTKWQQSVGSWAVSPNNGIVYNDTWRLIEDLEILLRRVAVKLEAKRKAAGKEGGNEEAKPVEELGSEYPSFQKSINELRLKADVSRNEEEAFDAHMAMGRTLFEHGFYEEALISFKKARELKPLDVRPHFRAGNALYSMGKYAEARNAFEHALDAERSSSPRFASLLPQIHINLGVTMEADGMLLCACDHYRHAAALNPAHSRALKLLGSALLGVGDYDAAVKALTDAITMKPDYADAHCDLGSALHALNDDDRAMGEFQRALDLMPGHLDALYNLGGLLRDSGKFERAAEMYTKVLGIRPSHWQAHLNRAVALLGSGDVDDAKKSLQEAFKLTNRVELYDAITRLKMLQKKPKGFAALIPSPQRDSDREAYGMSPIGSGATEATTVVVDSSRFQVSTSKTTPRQWMAHALHIRAFQRHTRLNRCDVSMISREIEEAKQKSVSKAELEKSLRRMLHFLGAETFQESIKAINQRIIRVLDRMGSGRVDLGMLFAILAPLCAGSVEKRKQIVFEALVWRCAGTDRIAMTDGKVYLKLLRAVYIPLHGASDLWEVHGEVDPATMSYEQLLEMFDDPDWGFGVMATLVKLESGDRERHGGLACAVCSYAIVGSRFKEVTSEFNLCSLCYSEGKVPANVKKEEYCFKEYDSEADAVKEKLSFLVSR
ncbi:hypothetical protein O6H91_Y479700 [Diphasiastrum complanatum]|nr:hypothetical protein O6H91_Y479700 [Diphasiastrum complanatum]